MVPQTIKGVSFFDVSRLEQASRQKGKKASRQAGKQAGFRKTRQENARTKRTCASVGFRL